MCTGVTFFALESGKLFFSPLRFAFCVFNEVLAVASINWRTETLLDLYVVLYG